MVPTDVSGQKDVLNNPVVIFEVLSPTTDDFDHGHKWKLYKLIPSLMHYVMIEQTSPDVEIYTRVNDRFWQYESVTGLDSILRLPHVDIEISLAALYDGISFPE